MPQIQRNCIIIHNVLINRNVPHLSRKINTQYTSFEKVKAVTC